MIRNMRIGTKLSLIGSLLIIIPLAVVSLISVFQATSAIEDQIHSQILSRTRDIAIGIENNFRVETKFVQSMAAENDLIEALSLLKAKKTEEAQPFLQRTLDNFERVFSRSGMKVQYDEYALIDFYGNLVATLNKDAMGISLTDREYFIEGMKGKDYISKPLLNKITGVPFVAVAVPVLSYNNEIVGVLSFLVKIGFLSELVTNSTIGETGYAYILDTNGIFIAHPDPATIMKSDVNNLAGMETYAKKIKTEESGN